MIKKHFLGILFAVVLSVFVFNVEAEEVLMLKSELGSNWRNNTNGTVGLAFVTGSAPKIVDQLGMIDQNEDGLLASHRIGIWDSAGSLIAQATVPSGTEGTLSDGFRYAPIDGGFVMLEPNTEYKLGAEVFSGGDYWLNASNVIELNDYYIGPDSTWECRYVGGGVFSDPVNGTNWGDGRAYGAPNMRTAGQYSSLWCYWKLDELFGAIAKDVSGYDRNGMLLGELRFENDSVAGKDINAVALDGVDDSISYTFSEVYFNNFTISLWAKTTAFGQWQYSSVFNCHAGTGGGFQIDVDGTSPGNYRYISNSGSITIGQVSDDWAHLAVVFDGTDTKVYYNGYFVDSENYGDALFNQIVIGKNRGSSVFFEGSVDDLQIYNTALNDSQILYIFNNPGTYYSDVPVAYAPSPPDQSWDVPVDTDFQWSVAGDLDFVPKFDVYLGFDAQSLVKVIDNQSSLSFDYWHTFAEGENYCWRVDVVNEETSPETEYFGRVWSFVTSAPILEICHWPLNEVYESAGDYYTPDISSSGYDGMIMNSPVASPNLVSGVDGNSLELFGEKDCVVYEDADTLPIEEYDTWTMNFYLKIFPENNEWTRIASLGEDNQRALYLLENEKLGFMYQDEFLLIPNFSLYPGQWHMVTVAKSPGTINIYIDGEQLVSRTLPLTQADEIGPYESLTYYHNESSFSGLIDEFKVFRGAITSDEVLNLLSLLPLKSDINNTGNVDFFDLQMIGKHWLLTQGLPSTVQIVDDIESYNSTTFEQYWTPRNDLPSHNSLNLLTAGGFSGSKAVEWVYDYNEGRTIGCELTLPVSVTDLNKYDELHIQIYKEQNSAGENLWCEFINTDFPLTGDQWAMARADYPGGVSALPDDQWVKWVIDLDKLKSPHSPDIYVPSKRISNLTKLYFGGFCDFGGAGAVRLDDIELHRNSPHCTRAQQLEEDINGDCKIDLLDVNILVIDWLKIK